MENNQDTTTQQEGTQQTMGAAQQPDLGQQSEKLFTQADVDRIVGNRLARMKQDLETSDTYRRERDEARRELEEYKNNAFLKEKGVRDEERDYVIFKASKLIDDQTDFKQAVEKFLKDNPRFSGKGYRVVSTGLPDRGTGSTGDMNDYGRTSESRDRYGKVQGLNATTQRCELTKDRSFTFAIDALDEDETVGALEASSALARQIREKVIPEVDTHVYGKMCVGAGYKPAAIELTATNIYDEIIKAGKEMDNAEVPETGRVLVVTPDTYYLMKKCKEIVMETNIGEEMRVKGVIGNLDGANVQKIPANRLPKNFGFMLVHPCATVAPTKLADYNTHHNPPGINGELVEGRIVYDAFVLSNKKKAIYYQENKPVAEPEGSTE